VKASAQWEHDNLAADLSAHLKAPDRMIWTNMQLGPQGSPRPDVYTIEKSFVRPCPMAYEVKISVSDFRSDVTSGKWSAYLEYAFGVVFAAPAGLVAKGDVPEMCGLILRHENAWRFAKRPVINPRPIAPEAFLKLLIDGVTREGPVQRAKRWKDQENQRSFDKRFGSTAARYVADAASVQKTIEYARDNAKRIVEQARTEADAIRKEVHEMAPQMWQELVSALGLAADANRLDVNYKIRELREGPGELRDFRLVLKALKRLTDNNAHYIEKEDVSA
jgi:hypothetical protein